MWINNLSRRVVASLTSYLSAIVLDVIARKVEPRMEGMREYQPQVIRNQTILMNQLLEVGEKLRSMTEFGRLQPLDTVSAIVVDAVVRKIEPGMEELREHQQELLRNQTALMNQLLEFGEALREPRMEELREHQQQVLRNQTALMNQLLELGEALRSMTEFGRLHTLDTVLAQDQVTKGSASEQ